jgi:hypothetical protein
MQDTFAALGLGQELLTELATLGYEEPTPIQKAAIAPLIEGKDLLGQAATGTGKTAAFALPILQLLQATGGAFADLGVSRATESQRIEISGGPSSGSAEFRLGDVSFSGTWSGSAESFRTSLLESLASAGLGDMSVTHSSGASDIFTLSFLGSLDNKSHPLVELVENSLSGSPSISITRVTSGSPINTVAPLIPTRSTPPAGVTFLPTSGSSKITIGNLGPGDSMPIWMRRKTPAGTEFKEGDSVTVRLSGDPFGGEPS